MDFRAKIDELDKIIKILLFLCVGPIVGGLYRFTPESVVKGIIWIITGGFFGIGAILDLINVITDKKPSIFID